MRSVTATRFIVLPESRTKNEQAHLIPLSAEAQALLANRSSQTDVIFGDVKPFAS
jgi:hypothetical protein